MFVYSAHADRSHKSVWLLLGLVLWWCCGLTFAHAADLSKEYKLKAAYLFNFTKFIKWPSDSFENIDDPVVLCLQPDDYFAKFISALVTSRRVGPEKRLVKIEVLENSLKPSMCHIFYLKTPHKKNSEIDCQCLIVGDNPSLMKYGTTINFYKENRRVRFEIDARKAKNLGITLSSELLKLGRRIERP